MKKIFLFLIPVLLTSCGWFPNQREAFIDLCVLQLSDNENIHLTDDQIKEACVCSQEKVESKYSWEEFKEEQNTQETQDLLESCFTDLVKD